MGSKLFVGNLDFRTTQEEVEALFSQVGPLEDVFLPTDRATGRPRGFAFVTYQSDEKAAEAIEKFNGYELAGRALRVNQAEERPRRQGGGGGFGGGGFDEGGGFGGDRRGGGGFGGGKSKGSRRNIRAKKRSF